MNLTIEQLKEAFLPVLKLALAEDVGDSDITTDAVIDPQRMGNAHIIAKEDLILCGLPFVEQIFNWGGKAGQIVHHRKDGDAVKNGETVLDIQAPLAQILTMERTAINILQHLSGVASKTHQFVKALEGGRVKLLDTRKTTPGLRLLEKYAVKTGGGTNHRMGLYEFYMIKDNHIEAAGSVRQAIRAVRMHNKKKLTIEVECKTIEQVEEAMVDSPDIILLDNMDDLKIKKAVAVINRRCKIEVSGNITLGRLPGLARLDIDYVSTGTITHSVAAKDFSLSIRS